MVGLAFWMVASITDELAVKIAITLMSCFSALILITKGPNQFWSIAIGTITNMGQGIAFWLGLGPSISQPEVAVPLCAVALMIINLGYHNAHQFQEALRVFAEKDALLATLEHDKHEITSALGKASAASESKSRLLAAASHDLRQPLNALTMFIGTLTFHVTTDEAKRLLNRIKEAAAVLEEQFDGLLDLSKLDANAIAPSIAPFRLDKLIEGVVEEIRPEADAKNLVLSAVVDQAMALSDSLLVGRVLRNLLGNAVKYTPTGSVRVDLHAGPKEFTIEVIDTGPGIPDDQHVRIFDEYFQLPTDTPHARHGAGLGLAIVKRIDALLNLRLELRSAMGHGSCFSFRLPRTPGNAPTHESAPLFDVTTLLTSTTVWVVDDEASVRLGMSSLLSHWGAQVETFTDTDTLFARMRSDSKRPYWILMDVRLREERSGIDAANILLKEFGFSRVCLMTGDTSSKVLAEARKSGFLLLHKPLKATQLKTVLTSNEPWPRNLSRP